MESQSLSFDALSGRPEIGTLAYWLGVLAPREVDAVASAAGLASLMAFQYGIEEQAGSTGRLFPDSEVALHFRPVAPVQLTRRWSPFDAAMAMLGRPTRLLVDSDPLGTRCFAAIWPPGSLASAPTTPPHPSDADGRRFRSPCEVSLVRARGEARAIMLIGKPGWSYDHAVEMDPKTAAAMRHAGFVVTDRHA